MGGKGLFPLPLITEDTEILEETERNFYRRKRGRKY